MGEIDQVHQFARASVNLRARAASQRHRQLDVIEGGQVGDQIAAALLPDKADLDLSISGQFAGAELEQVLAVDDDLAR